MYIDPHKKEQEIEPINASMDDVVGSVLSDKTTQVEIKPNLVEEHQLPENIARYSDNGNDVDLRFDRDDQSIWATAKNIADIYQSDVSNIRKAIANIYSDEELSEESTRVKFTLVQSVNKNPFH